MSVAQSSQEFALPLPVALTPPVPGFALTEEYAELARFERGELYDPVRQLNVTADGLPFIEMRGSRCSGICGTRLGTIIISDRDRVRDD